MTSAVTCSPSSLARRTDAMLPRVEMWAMCTRPPVRAASRTSRSTMISSASAGMPRRPRAVDTAPSCMTPPAARVGSSQWSMTGMPKIRQYSSARRMSSAEWTGRPSSETATQPDSTRSPISASSSPAIPLLTQPMGWTRTTPRRAASCTMNSVTDWSSLTGEVLGMAATAVKPPAAAARVPV